VKFKLFAPHTEEEFKAIMDSGAEHITLFTKLEELQEKHGEDHVYCEVFYEDDNFKEMFGDALIREN